MTDKEIGSRIAYFRNRKGLTQTELAKKVNLTQVQLSNREKGVFPAKATEIYAIAKVLDISVEELMN